VFIKNRMSSVVRTAAFVRRTQIRPRDRLVLTTRKRRRCRSAYRDIHRGGILCYAPVPSRS
jgi:hypothetical protein